MIWVMMNWWRMNINKINISLTTTMLELATAVTMIMNKKKRRMRIINTMEMEYDTIKHMKNDIKYKLLRVSFILLGVVNIINLTRLRIYFR